MTPGVETERSKSWHYPGAEAPCDRVCRVPFLGNLWPLGDEAFTLTAVGFDDETRTYRFTNSEAAYQALKFWDRGRLFEQVDGNGALALRRRSPGQKTGPTVGMETAGAEWSRC